MYKNELLFAILIIHIIGAVITMIIHYKDGTFNGDGIRFSRPSDVIFLDCIADGIFLDCIAWEVLLLLFVMDFIEAKINKYFERIERKYKEK